MSATAPSSRPLHQANRLPTRRAPDGDIIRITLLATIAIILSIAFAGYVSYTVTKNAVLEKLTSEDLVTIAELVSSRIDNRIEQAKEVSLMLARDPQVLEWVARGEPEGLDREYALQKLHTLVTDFDYTNSFIVSATTFNYWDEKGNVIDVVSSEDPDDDWFFDIINAGSPMSVVHDYNAERQSTFVFIDALMGDPTQPLGIAGVGLGLEGLSEYLASSKHGEEGALWVIDKDGNIYLSDDATHNGKRLAPVLGEEAERQVLDAVRTAPLQHHTLEVMGLDNVLTDVIAYPLTSTEWFLLVQTPRHASIGFLNAIRVQSLLASIVVLLAMTISFYLLSNRLVNPYKRARELNQELERKVQERTAELHEKNTALTDSINYARRIQRSILPPEELLEEAFGDRLLVWQPRDIVGGDFYWVKQVGNGWVIVVGDCTGHGVPGALMSMISVSILNQVVGDYLHDPAAILAELNQRIKRMLQQETAAGALTDDGLDIGVCHFDGENQVTYAGARLGLYVWDKTGLTIVPGDRTSVGYTRTRADYAFTNHVVSLQGGERFYLTTDGYIDQHGGPKGVSFGKTRFAETIEALAPFPLSQQQEAFAQRLNEHMGDNPQLDDITLLGFTLPSTFHRTVNSSWL